MAKTVESSFCASGGGCSKGGVFDYPVDADRNENWSARLDLHLPTQADVDGGGQALTGESVSNPANCQGVVLDSGNPVYKEIDFETAGEMPMSLTRVYNKAVGHGIFGSQWSSSLDYSVRWALHSRQCLREEGGPLPEACDGGIGPSKLIVSRPGAVEISLLSNGDHTYGAAGVVGRFWAAELTDGAGNRTGWQVHTDDDRLETYTADGQPLTLLDKYGVGWTYTYPSGSKTIITHSSGRTIQLNLVDKTYGNSTIKQVSSLVDPNGSTHQYTYVDSYYYSQLTGQKTLSTFRLAGVTLPNGETRTYQYALRGQEPKGTLQHALTGVLRNGQPYASYDYYPDSGDPGAPSIQDPTRYVAEFKDGRVKESSLADGKQKMTFNYSRDATTGAQTTTVTNALGGSWDYQYGFALTRKALKDASGPGANACPNTAQHIEYDASGNPNDLTDWNGNPVHVEYNDKRQIVREVTGAVVNGVDERRGKITEWEADQVAVKSERVYDGTPESGSLVLETLYKYYPATDPAKFRLKSVTQTNYSSVGVTGQTRVTNYSYQFHANNLISEMTVDGPLPGNQDAVTSTYNEQGDLLAVTNALGHSTSYSGHNGFGEAGVSTDPNGLNTQFTFDERGRTKTTRQIVGTQVRVTTLDYDPYGTVSKTTYPDLAALHTKYGVDGSLYQSDHYGSDAEKFAYNKLGGATQHVKTRRTQYHARPQDCTSTQDTLLGVNPFVDTGTLADTLVLTSPVQNSTLNQALALEPISSVLQPPFYPDQLSNYALGENALPVDMALSALGNTGVAGQKAQATAYCSTASVNYDEDVYFSETWLRDDPDGLGRVRQHKGAMGQITTYTYWPGGEVKTETDNLGRTTRYFYNSHNELALVIDPDNHETRYSYDWAGGKKVVTDAKGRDTQYERDGFGNLISVNGPDTHPTSYAFDEGGRMTLMRRFNNDETLYSYNDPLGRLSSVTAGSDFVNYSYDACANGKGRQCSVSYNGGSESYAYNPTGTLSTRTQVIGSTPYTLGWTYDIRDRTQMITYPGGTLGARYGYDGEGRQTSVDAVTLDPTSGAVTASSSVVNSAAYYPYGPLSTWKYGNNLIRAQVHDGSYRVKTLYTAGIQSLTLGFDTVDDLRTIDNTIDASLSHGLGYDNLHRLHTAVRSGVNETWNLDEIGNRTSYSWTGVSDADNPAAYASHVAGGYDYDKLNRMSAFKNPSGATIAGYTYNQLNLRTQKTGTLHNFRYLYDAGGSLLAETTVSGSESFNRFYIWFNGEIVGLVNSGALYYVHNDQLGRPEAVTDSSGAKQWYAKNFAYSRTIAQNNIGGFNVGFPGQYFDDETHLWYNWNRYYDAATGQYTQSDPMGLGGGLNTFAYAFANPLSRIDATGLAGVDFQEYARPGGKVDFGKELAGWGKRDALSDSMGEQTSQLERGVGAVVGTAMGVGATGALAVTHPGIAWNLAQLFSAFDRAAVFGQEVVEGTSMVWEEAEGLADVGATKIEELFHAAGLEFP